MSGPKVVRIVSPEEYALLETERDRLLSDLQLAIERHLSCLKELGFKTADKSLDMQLCVNELRKNFFPAFDKSVMKVRKEMKQLEADTQEARIQYRTMQREQRRRLESTARALSNELATTGVKGSADLQHVIDRVQSASEAELQSFHKIVNEAVSALVKFTAQTETKSEPSALAKELSTGLAEIERIENRMLKTDAHSPAASNRDKRLDRLMAEIELMEADADTGKFFNRSKELVKEPAGQRRELLTDSLILDISAHCKRHRERREAVYLLSEIKASLLQKEQNLPVDIIKEIDSAIANPPSLKIVEALAEKAQNISLQELSKSHSQAKRKAILKSFAELGYEVREGMDTIWAKNGKLVLSRKEKPAVGVELGSGDSLERLQMRAVSIVPKGSKRDPNEDTNIEIAWCGDLDKVKASLQAAGHLFVIEQAQPIGKVPVKVCEPVVWIVFGKLNCSQCGNRKCCHLSSGSESVPPSNLELGWLGWGVMRD